MATSRKVLINLYTTMLAIRRFEEKVAEEVYAGNVPGFVHSYIGQEAVAAGVCGHMTKADRIVSNHRGHGHCIAKGADVNRMMAEIYGKKTGSCKGKGGSMHIAEFGVGMLGADGIVGAGLPIATGAAFAAQLEKKRTIAAVFFGDGACQEGELHETMNLAAIWKLPLLFVCENNGYGVNTSAAYALGAKEITQMPAAYGIAHSVVDGNDVEAVYAAAEKIVAALRKGEGPYFLECRTYRWHKHFLSAGLEDLRPPDELASWKRKCPIAVFEKKLIARGVLTAAASKRMNKTIVKRIEAAHAFALDSPYPDPEEALQDVYSA